MKASFISRVGQCETTHATISAAIACVSAAHCYGRISKVLAAA